MLRLVAAQVALGVALAAGLSLSANAAPVSVANSGFEDLYLGSNLPAQYAGDVPTGSFPTGPAPAGWTGYFETGSPVASQFLGVLNPGTTADHAPGSPCFPDGAPEGDNVALLFTGGDVGGNEYGIEQELTDTVTANTVYELTVEVGDIQTCAGLVSPYNSLFDLRGFPSYRVQLVAGGQVLAEDPGLLTPGDGVFLTTTVHFVTGAQPQQIDEQITIRLVNRNQPDIAGVDGLEVDFDDVRLDASPAASVPSASWAGPLLTAALMGLGVARARRGDRALR